MYFFTLKTKIYIIFANLSLLLAQVAELVDALDSKSSSFGSVGSIPTLSTQGRPQLFTVEVFY